MLPNTRGVRRLLWPMQRSARKTRPSGGYNLPRTGPSFAENDIQYETGALRGDSSGRPRPDLIPGVCNLRVGMHYSLGALHYGERNFEKGLPSSRALESLERHLQQFKDGDTSEDHLSAIVFNANCLIFNEEKAGTGQFPDDSAILDLPWYKENS